jgi:hypothetical protein
MTSNTKLILFLIKITIVLCGENYNDANDKFKLIKNLTNLSKHKASVGESCYQDECDGHNTECYFYICECIPQYYVNNKICEYGFKWGETRCEFDSDCTAVDDN